jgi:hypothetical protein
VAEIVEPAVNDQDFHFSASPTVTTGFIAFAFDIRKEQKYTKEAQSRETPYAGRSRSCRRYDDHGNYGQQI